MFRYYSMFSPRGVPEQAALLAAAPIRHEWEWDPEVENWILNVYGLLTLVDVFFCANKDFLFLHENMKISKIPFPKNAKFKDFIFCAWDADGASLGVKAGVAPPRLDMPVHWFYQNGDVVDLLSLDRKSFSRTPSGAFSLPIYKWAGSGNDFCVWVPPRLLSFLKEQLEVKIIINVEGAQGEQKVDIKIQTRLVKFQKFFDLPSDYEKVREGLGSFISDGVLRIPSNVE